MIFCFCICIKRFKIILIKWLMNNMVDFVNVVKRLCVIIDVFFVCLLGSGVFK